MNTLGKKEVEARTTVSSLLCSKTTLIVLRDSLQERFLRNLFVGDDVELLFVRIPEGHDFSDADADRICKDIKQAASSLKAPTKIIFVEPSAAMLSFNLPARFSNVILYHRFIDLLLRVKSIFNYEDGCAEIEKVLESQSQGQISIKQFSKLYVSTKENIFVTAHSTTGKTYCVNVLKTMMPSRIVFDADAFGCRGWRDPVHDWYIAPRLFKGLYDVGMLRTAIRIIGFGTCGNIEELLNDLNESRSARTVTFALRYDDYLISNEAALKERAAWWVKKRASVKTRLDYYLELVDYVSHTRDFFYREMSSD